MINKKKNNKGFTLVELLVVIAIIGILAVVAVPALFKNINKAKVADVESDYSAIKSAVLSYYTDKNTFPITTTDSTGGQSVTTNWDKKLADHMDSVPTDSPLNGTYNLDLVETKLYLSISGANITEEQLTKLTQDIGIGKVFVKAVPNQQQTPVISFSTQQPAKVYTEVILDGAGKNISTLAGENVTIGLVLIENTDM